GPADQSVFTTPASIPISATAQSGGAPVSVVKFYADGVDLGSSFSAPYQMIWNNAAEGVHVLTAVAAAGTLQITSPPLRMQVVTPVPPPVTLSLIATGSSWRY